MIENDIKTDRILYMTSHCWSWSKRKDCPALCYTAPAGRSNDGTPQFNLRAKIEDGIKKTNRNL